MQVLEQTQQVLASITNAETGQRGFLLTARRALPRSPTRWRRASCRASYSACASLTA